MADTIFVNTPDIQARVANRLAKLERTVKRGCTTREQIERALSLFNNLAPPVTLTATPGVPRTLSQNALLWKWMGEAAAHFGDRTPEELHAYCKLHFGVPILREDEDFRKAYDEVLKPMTYELKLKAMSAPLDFNVTRLMNTRQLSRYLDDVYDFLTGEGCHLTVPSDELTQES